MVYHEFVYNDGKPHESVQVAGEFSNWEALSLMPASVHSSKFILKVHNLQPNRRYMYKYIVDGSWTLDDNRGDLERCFDDAGFVNHYFTSAPPMADMATTKSKGTSGPISEPSGKLPTPPHETAYSTSHKGGSLEGSRNTAPSGLIGAPPARAAIMGSTGNAGAIAGSHAPRGGAAPVISTTTNSIGHVDVVPGTFPSETYERVLDDELNNGKTGVNVSTGLPYKTAASVPRTESGKVPTTASTHIREAPELSGLTSGNDRGVGLTGKSPVKPIASAVQPSYIDVDNQKLCTQANICARTGGECVCEQARMSKLANMCECAKETCHSSDKARRPSYEDLVARAEKHRLEVSGVQNTIDPTTRDTVRVSALTGSGIPGSEKVKEMEMKSSLENPPPDIDVVNEQCRLGKLSDITQAAQERAIETEVEKNYINPPLTEQQASLLKDEVQAVPRNESPTLTGTVGSGGYVIATTSTAYTTEKKVVEDGMESTTNDVLTANPDSEERRNYQQHTPRLTLRDGSPPPVRKRSRFWQKVSNSFRKPNKV